MSKTRVYELAKELNVASKEIIEKAKEVVLVDSFLNLLDGCLNNG